MDSLKSGTRRKAYATKRAFGSWSAFKAAVQVPDTALDGHCSNERTWTNEDLDPTPPSRRTWQWWNFVIFYWGLSFGNWSLGAALIGTGLVWWEAILAVFLSQLISSIAMFFNSRAASVYGIGFPVTARANFGVWGAYYFVGARAALAVIWYGVQLFSGSALLANMLRACFGHNYTAGIPNMIPPSVGITSAGMLAFFLFWLAHLPLTFFRPYQLRGFFWAKAAIMLPAILGLFIFCMVCWEYLSHSSHQDPS